EAAVLNAIKGHLHRTASPEVAAGYVGLTDGELVERYIEKIVIKQGAVEIIWANQEGIAQLAPLTVSWSPIPSARKRETILPTDGRVAPQRPIRSDTPPP